MRFEEPSWKWAASFPRLGSWILCLRKENWATAGIHHSLPLDIQMWCKQLLQAPAALTSPPRCTLELGAEIIFSRWSCLIGGSMIATDKEAKVMVNSEAALLSAKWVCSVSCAQKGNGDSDASLLEESNCLFMSWVPDGPLLHTPLSTHSIRRHLSSILRNRDNSL